MLPVYQWLAYPDVCADLNLTREQREKLNEISWAWRHEMERQASQINSPSAREKMLAQVEQLKKSVRDRVERVLTPAQLASYKTLIFQRMARSVLELPKQRQAIGLTAKQDSECAKIIAEMYQRERRIARDATAKALQALTPEQSQQLKEILKADFDEQALISLLRSATCATVSI